MSIVPKQPLGFSGHDDDERAKAVGKYVHEKNGSYYLEFGPSGNFVLFQGSEVVGTYEVNSSAITLFVARKPISTARLEDGWIIDDQGDRWVRSSVPRITQQSERQNEPASAAAKLLGDFAPKQFQLTEDVLFADVWERKELSKRDRSLTGSTELLRASLYLRQRNGYGSAANRRYCDRALGKYMRFRSPKQGRTATPVVTTRALNAMCAARLSRPRPVLCTKEGTLKHNSPTSTRNELFEKPLDQSNITGQCRVDYPLWEKNDEADV